LKRIEEKLNLTYWKGKMNQLEGDSFPGSGFQQLYQRGSDQNGKEIELSLREKLCNCFE